MLSETKGRTRPDSFWPDPTTGSRSRSTNYSTVRQRVLTPGDVAQLPPGRGLLLRGTRWELVELAPWHASEPWRTVAGQG